MPLYVFTCLTCGKQFDQSVLLGDDFDNVTCPAGHRQVRRVYSPPAVLFRGSGWYSTDNPKGGQRSNDADRT